MENHQSNPPQKKRKRLLWISKYLPFPSRKQAFRQILYIRLSISKCLMMSLGRVLYRAQGFSGALTGSRCRSCWEGSISSDQTRPHLPWQFYCCPVDVCYSNIYTNDKLVGYVSLERKGLKWNLECLLNVMSQSHGKKSFSWFVTGQPFMLV